MKTTKALLSLYVEIKSFAEALEEGIEISKPDAEDLYEQLGSSGLSDGGKSLRYLSECLSRAENSESVPTFVSFWRTVESYDRSRDQNSVSDSAALQQMRAFRDAVFEHFKATDALPEEDAAENGVQMPVADLCTILRQFVERSDALVEWEHFHNAVEQSGQESLSIEQVSSAIQDWLSVQLDQVSSEDEDDDDDDIPDLPKQADAMFWRQSIAPGGRGHLAPSAARKSVAFTATPGNRKSIVHQSSRCVSSGGSPGPRSEGGDRSVGSGMEGRKVVPAGEVQSLIEEAVRKERGRLQEEVKDLHDEVERLGGLVKQADSRYAQQQKQIEEILDQERSLQHALEKSQATARSREQEVSKLRAALDETREELALVLSDKADLEKSLAKARQSGLAEAQGAVSPRPGGEAPQVSLQGLGLGAGSEIHTQLARLEIAKEEAEAETVRLQQEGKRKDAHIDSLEATLFKREQELALVTDTVALKSASLALQPEKEKINEASHGPNQAAATAPGMGLAQSHSPTPKAGPGVPNMPRLQLEMLGIKPNTNSTPPSGSATASMTTPGRPLASPQEAQVSPTAVIGALHKAVEEAREGQAKAEAQLRRMQLQAELAAEGHGGLGSSAQSLGEASGEGLREREELQRRLDDTEDALLRARAQLVDAVRHHGDSIGRAVEERSKKGGDASQSAASEGALGGSQAAGGESSDEDGDRGNAGGVKPRWRKEATLRDTKAFAEARTVLIGAPPESEDPAAAAALRRLRLALLDRERAVDALTARCYELEVAARGQKKSAVESQAAKVGAAAAAAGSVGEAQPRKSADLFSRALMFRDKENEVLRRQVETAEEAREALVDDVRMLAYTLVKIHCDGDLLAYSQGFAKELAEWEPTGEPPEDFDSIFGAALSEIPLTEEGIKHVRSELWRLQGRMRSKVIRGRGGSVNPVRPQFGASGDAGGVSGDTDSGSSSNGEGGGGTGLRGGSASHAEDVAGSPGCQGSVPFPHRPAFFWKDRDGEDREPSDGWSVPVNAVPEDPDRSSDPQPECASLMMLDSFAQDAVASADWGGDRTPLTPLAACEDFEILPFRPSVHMLVAEAVHAAGGSEAGDFGEGENETSGGVLLSPLMDGPQHRSRDLASQVSPSNLSPSSTVVTVSGDERGRLSGTDALRKQPVGSQKGNRAGCMSPSAAFSFPTTATVSIGEFEKMDMGREYFDLGGSVLSRSNPVSSSSRQASERNDRQRYEGDGAKLRPLPAQRQPMLSDGGLPSPPRVSLPIARRDGKNNKRVGRGKGKTEQESPEAAEWRSPMSISFTGLATRIIDAAAQAGRDGSEEGEDGTGDELERAEERDSDGHIEGMSSQEDSEVGSDESDLATDRFGRPRMDFQGPGGGTSPFSSLRLRAPALQAGGAETGASSLSRSRRTSQAPSAVGQERERSVGGGIRHRTGGGSADDEAQLLQEERDSCVDSLRSLSAKALEEELKRASETLSALLSDAIANSLGVTGKESIKKSLRGRGDKQVEEQNAILMAALRRMFGKPPPASRSPMRSGGVIGTADGVEVGSVPAAATAAAVSSSSPLSFSAMISSILDQDPILHTRGEGEGEGGAAARKKRQSPLSRKEGEEEESQTGEEGFQSDGLSEDSLPPNAKAVDAMPTRWEEGARRSPSGAPHLQQGFCPRSSGTLPVDGRVRSVVKAVVSELVDRVCVTRESRTASRSGMEGEENEVQDLKREPEAGITREKEEEKKIESFRAFFLACASGELGAVQDAERSLEACVPDLPAPLVHLVLCVLPAVSKRGWMALHLAAAAPCRKAAVLHHLLSGLRGSLDSARSLDLGDLLPSSFPSPSGSSETNAREETEGVSLLEVVESSALNARTLTDDTPFSVALSVRNYGAFVTFFTHPLTSGSAPKAKVDDAESETPAGGRATGKGEEVALLDLRPPRRLGPSLEGAAEMLDRRAFALVLSAYAKRLDTLKAIRQRNARRGEGRGVFSFLFGRGKKGRGAVVAKKETSKHPVANGLVPASGEKSPDGHTVEPRQKNTLQTANSAQTPPSAMPPLGTAFAPNESQKSPRPLSISIPPRGSDAPPPIESHDSEEEDEEEEANWWGGGFAYEFFTGRSKSRKPKPGGTRGKIKKIRGALQQTLTNAAPTEISDASESVAFTAPLPTAAAASCVPQLPPEGTAGVSVRAAPRRPGELPSHSSVVSAAASSAAQTVYRTVRRPLKKREKGKAAFSLSLLLGETDEEELEAWGESGEEAEDLSDLERDAKPIKKEDAVAPPSFPGRQPEREKGEAGEPPHRESESASSAKADQQERDRPLLSDTTPSSSSAAPPGSFEAPAAAAAKAKEWFSTVLAKGRQWLDTGKKGEEGQEVQSGVEERETPAMNPAVNREVPLDGAGGPGRRVVQHVESGGLVVGRTLTAATTAETDVEQSDHCGGKKGDEKGSGGSLQGFVVPEGDGEEAEGVGTGASSSSSSSAAVTPPLELPLESDREAKREHPPGVEGEEGEAEMETKSSSSSVAAARGAALGSCLLMWGLNAVDEELLRLAVEHTKEVVPPSQDLEGVKGTEGGGTPDAVVYTGGVLFYNLLAPCSSRASVEQAKGGASSSSCGGLVDPSLSSQASSSSSSSSSASFGMTGQTNGADPSRQIESPSQPSVSSIRASLMVTRGDLVVSLRPPRRGSSGASSAWSEKEKRLLLLQRKRGQGETAEEKGVLVRVPLSEIWGVEIPLWSDSLLLVRLKKTVAPTPVHACTDALLLQVAPRSPLLEALGVLETESPFAPLSSFPSTEDGKGTQEEAGVGRGGPSESAGLHAEGHVPPSAFVCRRQSGTLSFSSSTEREEDPAGLDTTAQGQRDGVHMKKESAKTPPPGPLLPSLRRTQHNQDHPTLDGPDEARLPPPAPFGASLDKVTVALPHPQGEIGPLGGSSEADFGNRSGALQRGQLLSDEIPPTSHRSKTQVDLRKNEKKPGNKKKNRWDAFWSAALALSSSEDEEDEERENEWQAGQDAIPLPAPAVLPSHAATVTAMREDGEGGNQLFEVQQGGAESSLSISLSFSRRQKEKELQTGGMKTPTGAEASCASSSVPLTLGIHPFAEAGGVTADESLGGHPTVAVDERSNKEVQEPSGWSGWTAAFSTTLTAVAAGLSKSHEEGTEEPQPAARSPHKRLTGPTLRINNEPLMLTYALPPPSSKGPHVHGCGGGRSSSSSEAASSAPTHLQQRGVKAFPQLVLLPLRVCHTALAHHERKGGDEEEEKEEEGEEATSLESDGEREEVIAVVCAPLASCGAVCRFLSGLSREVRESDQATHLSISSTSINPQTRKTTRRPLSGMREGSLCLEAVRAWTSDRYPTPSTSRAVRASGGDGGRPELNRGSVGDEGGLSVSLSFSQEERGERKVGPGASLMLVFGRKKEGTPGVLALPVPSSLRDSLGASHSSSSSSSSSGSCGESTGRHKGGDNSRSGPPSRPSTTALPLPVCMEVGPGLSVQAPDSPADVFASLWGDTGREGGCVSDQRGEEMGFVAKCRRPGSSWVLDRL
uniref:Uncharacterized protein n=1 Tax=Chromera velia CCMP2878 TaxID=1169474 RepID=A0A0G4HWZ0_9ALVE|eukprot:Cvel_9135.t1-p1 / transcript=Cvel_9135.t1 / gene=Cvel_9135 / organism=Chromera_velia_CCMP2878 / gene_product=Myosin-4, putative / transcript_product=Myosin-4, putative / location=Cvel_scaffold519:53574-69031(-) / protein_length=3516 / sequence_SO=supercontig / SO=protein_coding / is_pseudo=false